MNKATRGWSHFFNEVKLLVNCADVAWKEEFREATKRDIGDPTGTRLF